MVTPKRDQMGAFARPSEASVHSAVARHRELHVSVIDESSDAPPATEATHEAVARPWLGPVRTAVRRVPAVVWWITALHVAVLLAYSVLLPTYRAPDEPLHMSLSEQFADELRYPAWDEGRTDMGIQRSARIVRFGDDSRHLTAAEAPPRDERPTTDELRAGDGRQGINQLTQHPPLYYVVTGSTMLAIETVVGEPIGSFDLQAWVYRLMSVAMIAPLPLLVWQAGRRLGVPAPVGVAATLVPLAIPQLSHIGSSANNDNLMLVLFWALTPVVIRVAGGALGPRTAVLAGVLTGLALLTKAFALVMLPWVGAALLLAAWRGGQAVRRSAIGFGLIYGAVSMALGGWWWVRNVVVHGRLSKSRMSELVPRREGVELDLPQFLDIWSERTLRRFWGRFGWHDTGLPDVAVVLATLVVVVALVLACRRRDGVAGTPLATRLLLVLPLVLLIGIQFQRGLNSHLNTGRWAGLQGRYWYGAIAALCLLVALGLAQLLGRWLPWLPAGVAAAAVTMHVLAVVALLSFYWGAPGSALVDRWRAVVGWAPVPPFLLVLGALAGGVALAGTAVQLVGLGREPARPRQ